MKNPFEAIDSRLSNIENLLLDLKHEPKKESITESNNPIGIKDVAELTGLTVPTLYGYVQRNEIPFNKKGNRLYFFNSDIINWIKTGKQKTLKELASEADTFLSNK